MSRETIDPNGLEKKFSEREMRLPSGVRRHIRRLKEEGKLEEALRIRTESTERKRSARERLEEKLNDNLRDALISDDPKAQALGAFTSTWILNKTGDIPDDERQADLATVYRNWPEQDNALIERASSIVVEISKLAKAAGE